MSKADDIFWRQFGLILALLIIFGVIVAFIARDIAGDAFEAAVNSPAAVAERIAPTGAVRVGDPAAVVAAAPAAAATTAMQAPAAAAASSGEAVYSGACAACHTAGVAGAPKLDDEAGWAPRLALGEDALVASVLNGKGAMPAKGGNPALSDDEIRAAVAYMIEQTGGGEPAPAAGGTAEQASSEAPAAASAPAGDAAGKPGDQVYNMGCVACHATGAANAPKLTDKAAWETRVAAGMDALVSSAVNGKGAMPAKGGIASLTDADITNAVLYMLEEAGVDSGS